MTDKSLRHQILEYIKNNGGNEDNIDIKTPFSHLLTDMDGRRKYLKAIGSLLEDGDIKLTNNSYGYMAYESGGTPKDITGISIFAKLKKAEQPTIGNIHIGDNYGNYNQLSRSEKSHVSPAQIKNKPDTINIILTAIGIIVAILLECILLICSYNDVNIRTKSKHFLTLDYKLTTANTGFASGGVACKLGTLCFYLSSVQVDSFVLRIPPERKALKRYTAF